MAILILEQIDEERLLIALSSEDMDILDLTFNQLSWKNNYSRQVIKKILKRAENEIGFFVGNNQLMIEAIPQNNGCVVLITLLAKDNVARKKFKIKENIKAYLFKFNTLDNLLSAIERLYKNKFSTLKSSAFENDKKYYILIYCKGCFSPKLLTLLTEYCDPRDNKSLSLGQILENGKLIAKNNAIEKIGNCLIKK